MWWSSLPFSWKRTRDRFLVFAFLATLIPGLVLGIFVSFEVRKAMIGQALGFQKSLSRTIRKGLTARIREFQERLAGLAADPEIQSMAPDRQRAAFFSFLDHHPLFYTIYAFDREGIVRSTVSRDRSERDSAQIGRNFLQGATPAARRAGEMLQAVLTKGESVVTSKMSTIQGRAHLLLQVPVRDFSFPASITGALSASLNIDGPAIQSLAAGAEGSDQGFLIITDGDGAPILRYGPRLPAGLEKVALSRPLAEGEEESTWTDLGSASFLVTVSRLPELNSLLFVGAPREAVVGTIDRTFGNMLVLAMLFSMIAAIVGGWFARSLVAPLSRLLEGIRKVGDGAISHRVEVDDESEIGEVAGAFNDLTRQLEKHRKLEDLWGKTWKPPV